MSTTNPSFCLHLVELVLDLGDPSYDLRPIGFVDLVGGNVFMSHNVNRLQLLQPDRIRVTIQYY